MNLEGNEIKKFRNRESDFDHEPRMQKMRLRGESRTKNQNLCSMRQKKENTQKIYLKNKFSVVLAKNIRIRECYNK